MQKLNFPDYSFRFKNSENKVAIFDVIRKKFIILTPEEWVRQHVVHYLINEKQYPKSHINVEKLIKVMVKLLCLWSVNLQLLPLRKTLLTKLLVTI